MAFMKKKTKQRCKTILSLFFALTLIMSAVTFAVSAAEAAALSVQLKTDKEEYTADEDIALTLEIRNGSTGRLVDIAYDITAPDGYELKSGSASGGETELLAGGTLKYDSVYSAVKATPDNPSTDGRINPTVPLISAVICAAALFALNRKKAKKMLASLLCVSLLLTALPLDVAAEEIGKATTDIADVTVTKDITAGGAKKTFTARVTAGKTADSVTVTYDTLGGNKIDSVTLAAGETIGRLPEAIKKNAVNNGWYLDKQCLTPFYEDEPVNRDITLYAGYDEDKIKPETPEYNEITISDAPEDFSFSLISSQSITDENLQDVISIENQFGEMPLLKVENTGSGVYTVKPVINWTEGGDTRTMGVWRPEQISCMIDNRSYFNGPSRYAIIHRIMKLSSGNAGNDNYVFPFSEFKKIDRKDPNVANGNSRRSGETFGGFDADRPPLGRPVMIDNLRK